MQTLRGLFISFPLLYFSELMDFDQRTHSASIVAGPNSYDPEKDDKRKGLKVIDIDCRGLEFTEFKPEVGFPPLSFYLAT